MPAMPSSPNATYEPFLNRYNHLRPFGLFFVQATFQVLELFFDFLDFSIDIEF